MNSRKLSSRGRHVSKSHTPQQKKNVQKEAKKSNNQSVRKPNDGIRLNKFISNSGICSRREADTYIEHGSVTVNAS